MNMHEQKKPNAAQKLAGFLSGKRLIMVIVFAAVLVGLVGILVFNEIVGANLEGAADEVEELRTEFVEWAADAGDSPEADERSQAIDEQATAIASRFSGTYFHGEALFIRGRLAFLLGNYADAAEHYLAVTQLRERHLTPLAHMNAAAALEEGGDLDAAAEQWRIVVEEYGASSTEAPRALFNLARASEAQGDYGQARSYLDRVIDEYSDTDWTNLARNRIILLSSEGLLD